MSPLHAEDLSTELLEQAINIVEWGKWSRGGLPTGKPGKGSTPSITDDQALRIDAQVTRLPKKAKYIIKELYIYNIRVDELAKRCGISARRVMSFRDQGLSMVYARLFP